MEIADPKDDHIHVIIRDVPVQVWDAYQTRSKREMPEQGEKAGISLLSEIMFQATDAPGLRNLVITDIPVESYAKFSALVAQLKMSDKPLALEEFFILLIKAADKDFRTLSILLSSFINAVSPDNCKRWGIDNIKKEAYQNLVEELKKIGVTPEEFLEKIADAAMQKQFKIQEMPDGNIQRQETAQQGEANSDKKGVGEYAQLRRAAIGRGKRRNAVDGAGSNGHAAPS